MTFLSKPCYTYDDEYCDSPFITLTPLRTSAGNPSLQNTTEEQFVVLIQHRNPFSSIPLSDDTRSIIIPIFINIHV